jgi:hypothetical protein
MLRNLNTKKMQPSLSEQIMEIKLSITLHGLRENWKTNVPVGLGA